MKKELCLIALIMFAKICSAQFAKGTKMLELSMSGSYSSGSDEQYSTTGDSRFSNKDYYFSFYPSYDIFIKENIMIGFGPTYRYNYNEFLSYYTHWPQEEETITKTNYYGARIALRKYYLIKKGFYWYLGFEAGYEYGVGTYSRNSIKNDLQASAIVANINGGFAYDFNRQWLLRGGIGNLGWSGNSEETKDDEGKLASKSSRSVLSFSAVYLTLGVSLILH